MKKVLCPTDFSETAHTAIAYAAKLARAMDAELTLLNVQSLFDYTPAEVIRGKDMTIAAAAERLEAQSREVSKAFSISCYSQVEPSHSKLSTVISKEASRFDLIVMGSDGPDDLYQFFSGSNTYNALIKSNTPLLLIPTGYVYSEIRHIVYAFDYLRGGKLPLTRLIPFIRPLNCRLTILQILEDQYSKKEEEQLMEHQHAISNLYSELKISYDTLRSSEVMQSINSYIIRNEPDVLALCSVHRNLLSRLFHKSIIKNITAFSSYPVLVFHE